MFRSASPIKNKADFAARLLAWHKRHGRHDLPWQGTRDAYRIWVAEIMLQQTQVSAVIPYYRRFLERFPNIAALAGAPQDEVLRLWSGLGYYSRARNLQRAAQLVQERHGGVFPRALTEIQALPGIGRSTAAAIAAFVYGTRAAILDGNVKRVLARHFAVAGFPGEKRVEERLWRLAEDQLPPRALGRYTQAMMDLGATLCTRAKPACANCPLAQSCRALALGRVRDFPAPRPAKAVPTRATHMLLLVRNGEVLLEKRPPSGIWGGLWSLPEIDDAARARAHCRTHYGCSIATPQPSAPLAHGFTHFKLQILPLLCRVEKLAPVAREAGQMWLSLEQAHGAAIPVPVRKLLERLLSQSCWWSRGRGRLTAAGA
ncbi:MAG: A/G-specific adenine glycosylase [Betaproteobacteria bacterium RIFCSPLOWO2_02_FULL_65_24]|nr:MAG: A/G-specific adenine glycosylase [Betaproteobacteria bacterium RIFCSPLOWO2_02_FULL_65_24]